jgi:hypothetical protein
MITANVPKLLRSAPDINAMHQYIDEVHNAWMIHWASRPDTRYGKDFAAFLGERILTDFDHRRTWV